MATMRQRVRKVDLSKNTVPAIVRKTVTRIESSVGRQLIISNIPALWAFRKSWTLQNFFTNHTDYEAIFGNHVDLMDRMVMSAISESVTADVAEAMATSKGHVGVWDDHTLYSIAASTVTFMRRDTEDRALFFTAQQFIQISEEDLAKLDPSTYMAFTGYTPQMFYQIYTQVIDSVVKTILNIMENSLPNAFLYSRDVPLEQRLCNEFQKFMKDDLDKLEISTDERPLGGHIMPTEQTVQTFLNQFQTPFIVLVSLYLQKSGLSENLVNLMLGMSRIHIIYSDPKGTNYRSIQMNFRVTAENVPGETKPQPVEFVATFGDILDCVYDLENMPKTRKESFGKALRGFITNLTTYSINTYMCVIAANKAESSGNETVGDMDELIAQTEE